MTLLNLNFSNPVSLIVNVAIIAFIVFEVFDGIKKGFLESGIRLLGVIGAFFGAFLLKNPLSVFMYTHFPFFKFGGLFEGVSALNIVVYEVIAFALIFIALIVIISIVAKVTGIVERVLSLIFFIGIPSKILGALVCFVKAMIILYFVSFVLKFGCNVTHFELKPSLVDDIVEVPLLKETFGDLLNSLDDITSLALEYEDTKDKDKFNYEVMDILIKYDIITKENLQILIDNGKIKKTEESES